MHVAVAPWRRPATASLTGLAAVAFLFTSAASRAQDTTRAADEADLEGLFSESVVSAASRTAESASEAPGTTWIISGTDLRRYGIQSVEQAIRYLGHGMTSYEYDQRLNAAFGARGYSSSNLGYHLAVLIDGNQAGGSAMTARGTQAYMMPIELVDHIEVVIGPGSVVYGNSAMLGVINVVTRSAASVERTELVAQGSGGAPADKWARDPSWGEAWGRTAAFGASKLRVGGDPFNIVWHGAVRWDRQQGRAVWRMRDGADVYAEEAAAYTREDVFNRDVRARLFGKAEWGNWKFMGWGAYAQGRGIGPIEGTGNSGYYEPELGLDAQWQKQVGARGHLSLRGYAVLFDSLVVTTPSAPDPQKCLDTVGVSACQESLHYISARPFFEPIFAFDWNQDGSQVTTAGAQVFIDGSFITPGMVGGGRKVEEKTTLAPLPNAAAYAQHIWRASFGTLNLGLRGDIGLLGSAVSPRAAFNRKIWEDGTLKLVFSTGFRTPVITERYLEIPGFLVGNPDIRPERVYSGEIDLAQRLGAQNLQLSFFGAFWDQLISARGVVVDGVSVTQFANVSRVWSAGVNAGWQGSRGPLDWGVSVNYAPGRRELPAGVALFTDQQLLDARLTRGAVDRFGWSAFGRTFLPSEAMPDGYGTAHVSWALGENLPRLSLAAQVNSPRLMTGYSNNAVLLDPRNENGPVIPWSADLRGVVEMPVHRDVSLRFAMTGSTVPTVPNATRVGDSNIPIPRGGIGLGNNPVAPLSAMLEANIRL